MQFSHFSLEAVIRFLQMALVRDTARKGSAKKEGEVR
jgi:hypothetical protein